MSQEKMTDITLLKFLKYLWILIFAAIIFLSIPMKHNLKPEKIEQYVKSTTLPIKIIDINTTIDSLEIHAVKNSKKMKLLFHTEGSIRAKGYSIGELYLKDLDLYFKPENIKIIEYQKTNYSILNKLAVYIEDKKIAEKIKENLNVKLYHTATDLSFVNMELGINNRGDSTYIYYKMYIKSYIFWLALLFTLIIYAKEIGIFFIEVYQEFISPRKGYRCAKGALYENGTCSSCVKEVMNEKGFIAGIKEYFKTTKECKEAMKIIEEKREKGEWKESKQEKSTKQENIEKGCLAGMVEESVCGCGELGVESACETGSCDIGSCDVGACDIAAC